MGESEMGEVIAVADSVGAWLLADEVYRGAERERREETPSFFGRYDKVVAVGSMSKAYGMPGLRLGWAVAPRKALDAMWRRHEYVTISTTKLANELGALALSPEVRPRLIERTRSYLRKGYPVLAGWMRAHGNTFSMTPPDAAAIAFLRYHLDVGSSDLVDRIRKEKSVLLVPGDHFGFDHYLRISYGLPEAYLEAALGRVHELLMQLAR
jgi:aspartate/methionine/tyrosine aminotransferase